MASDPSSSWEVGKRISKVSTAVITLIVLLAWQQIVCWDERKHPMSALSMGHISVLWRVTAD
jgi:hypothetical protein